VGSTLWITTKCGLISTLSLRRKAIWPTRSLTSQCKMPWAHNTAADVRYLSGGRDSTRTIPRPRNFRPHVGVTSGRIRISSFSSSRDRRQRPTRYAQSKPKVAYSPGRCRCPAHFSRRVRRTLVLVATPVTTDIRHLLAYQHAAFPAAPRRRHEQPLSRSFIILGVNCCRDFLLLLHISGS